MTTAAIMTMISLAMPTAVMTESRLKMMSSSMIWMIVPQKELARPGFADVVVALHAAVDLPGGLGDEEEAAHDEDDVAAAELEAGDLEERLREADDPVDAQQQQDAHAHRGQDADAPGPVALVVRQLVGQDGDEDDVVDAEDDLERRQRQQRDPDLGVQQQVHSPETSRSSHQRPGERLRTGSAEHRRYHEWPCVTPSQTSSWPSSGQASSATTRRSPDPSASAASPTPTTRPPAAT